MTDIKTGLLRHKDYKLSVFIFEGNNCMCQRPIKIGLRTCYRDFISPLHIAQFHQSKDTIPQTED